MVIVIWLALTFTVEAQSTINYPFGAADYQTGTISGDTAIYITCSNQWTLITAAIDTTVQIRVTVGGGIKNGALLFLKLTADGTNRPITFPAGVTAAGETLTASKTKLWTFVYMGGFFQFAENQVD